MIVESWDRFKWNIREGDRYKHDSAVLSKEELAVLRGLECLSKTGDIFADVGAHVGYYTVRMAKIFKHVYAFEPNPESLENLKRNIKLNNITNVTVYDFALGSSESIMTLHLRSASSTLLPRHLWNVVPDMKYIGDIQVQVKRMDDVIDGADVVKIDVEGYEWEVLSGMDRIINESKPSLIIEHHEERGYRISVKDRIKKELNRKGYISIYLRPEHTLYYHSSRDLMKIADLIYYHWVNHCINNLRRNFPWYYGLPYTWWWGMDLLDFILELREHIETEDEWIKRLG